MTILREVLKRAGWRQGVILEPHDDILNQPDALGYIVLNQTCDCISHDLTNEPYFEVLPFSSVPEKPDTQLVNGRNARRIHFELLKRGKPLWVSSRMADVKFIERCKHAALKLSDEYVLPPSCLEGLIAWRAARYLRPAFPDHFENALRIPMKKIAKLLKEKEALLDCILLSLDPYAELSDGECYEVQLRLMVTPDIFGDSGKMADVIKLAEEIQVKLEDVKIFDGPICSAQSLGEMTLFERQKFLDFNRYDYLSFGRDL